MHVVENVWKTIVKMHDKNKSIKSVVEKFIKFKLSNLPSAFMYSSNCSLLSNLYLRPSQAIFNELLLI